jgi:hypothetical protein
MGDREWFSDSFIGDDAYEDPDTPFVQVGDVKWIPDKVEVPAALQQIADARLMAAAHKLYEALEHAKAMLEKYEEDTTGKCFNSPMINAALAKARGERDE